MACWHRGFGRGGASHRILFAVPEGVWAVCCAALLNVDTVSVWVTVCCSLSYNDLDEECCVAINAQAPSGCVVSLEEDDY